MNYSPARPTARRTRAPRPKRITTTTTPPPPTTTTASRSAARQNQAATRANAKESFAAVAPPPPCLFDTAAKSHSLALLISNKASVCVI